MSKINVPVCDRVLGVLAGTTPNYYYGEMSNCSKYGPETPSQSGTLLPEWAGAARPRQVHLDQKISWWASNTVRYTPDRRLHVSVHVKIIPELFYLVVFYLSDYSRHSLEASPLIFLLWCQQKHTQKHTCRYFLRYLTFFKFIYWTGFGQYTQRNHENNTVSMLCRTLH